MEEQPDDCPGGMTVGIIYNSKKSAPKGAAPDDEAEYDNPATIAAIQKALNAGGSRTVLLEGDGTLPEHLQRTHVDIAFNIAEGLRSRGREAEIPALLNLLGIPFTGSDETALCIALDKALTKRLVSTYGIRTPGYAVVESEKDAEALDLRFPVIVKPNAEGSSKGIPDACVAADREKLLEMLRRGLKLYREPMLVEEYISGREFTVGLLGNGARTRVFSPMEIVFRRDTNESYRVYSFGVKQNYKQYIDYKCPSYLTPKQDEEMRGMALGAFRALGCRDFARADFRMAEDGTIYFIEINPLPGLAPGYSDYPMLADFCGVSYDELVLSVLHAALARLGMEAAGK
jgi:D-alanine-D-alanine ligase